LAKHFQPVQGTIHKAEQWSKSITPMSSQGTILTTLRNFPRTMQNGLSCKAPGILLRHGKNHSRYLYFQKTAQEWWKPYILNPPDPLLTFTSNYLDFPRRASCSIWEDRPFRRSCPQARQPNYEGPSSSGQIFHPIHHYRRQNLISTKQPCSIGFYAGLAPRLKNELAHLIYSTSHPVGTPTRSPPNR